MSAVKIAKAGETVVIWQYTEAACDCVILTRLQVANLVQELDAWLSYGRATRTGGIMSAACLHDFHITWDRYWRRHVRRCWKCFCTKPLLGEDQ